MLSKVVGASAVLTLSATTQTVTPSTFSGAVPKVVRVATNSQPAYINFNTAANSSTGILLPSNHVEHFKLDNVSVTVAASTASNYLVTGYAQTCTVSVLQAGTAGLISITTVA
jgi:hypothetical protein